MAKSNLNRREFLGRTSAGLAVAGAMPQSLKASGNPNALAIHGGTPVRSTPFPDWPQTDERDEQILLKSLRNHKWCTTDAEFIPKFENEWTRRVGSRGCVMTPCGTHALQLALELIGVGPGDEVIVSPYTYIATVDAIMLSYALPVFADTDLKTFQINPDDIEHRITEHTRAILPAHMFGATVQVDKIMEIGRKHNLPVIEDACQGHGTEWKGKHVGTFGVMGCFSFQESKNLPGGEAGALVSNDPDLIAKAYMVRNFGLDPKTHRYSMRGTKYRISDFAAAVLMGQFGRYDELSVKREKHAAYLRAQLRTFPGMFVQENYPESNRQNYYCTGLRYDQDHFKGVPRAKVVRALEAEGVMAVNGYPPLNKEPYLEQSLNLRSFKTVFSEERLNNYRKKNVLPQNDKLCETGLYLAQNMLIGEKSDVDDVLEAFNKVQRNAEMLA